MITAQDALRALDEVVKGKENFVYTHIDGKCWYVIDKKCSCIVGHALHYLGYSIEEISNLEDHYERISLRATVIYTRLDNIEEDACEVLNIAQESQDNGDTWGQAVQSAREYFEEIVRYV